MPAKVNGTAVYGIDVRPPGVKIATLVQSPVFGGRVKSVNDAVGQARQRRATDRAAGRCRRDRGRPYGRCEERPRGACDRMGRRSARQARHRRDRGRIRKSDAQFRRGGTEHRGRRQGDGERGHQGRGDLPGSVPRARDDGADELHRPRPQGRLRDLGRQPGHRSLPSGSGEGHEPAAGQGRGPQPSDRRRLRPATGERWCRSRRPDRACRWTVP